MKKFGEEGGGGNEDFTSKNFCLTVPKISVRESTVALNCGSEKVWIGGGGVSKFSSEILLSHSAENFRSGIYCWINFR